MFLKCNNLCILTHLFVWLMDWVVACYQFIQSFWVFLFDWLITSFIYSLHAGVKVLFLICVDCICFTLCANHFHRLQHLHLYRYCYLFVVYLFHSLQQLVCCMKLNLLVCACLFTYGAVWKQAVGFIIDGCDTVMKFAHVQVCVCVC